ncbi:MAG: hypothetical protein IPJ22_04820 [Bacteroidetes bacterium]|nr:hypothetical protein [Bacteroidota bacterium]
MKTCIKLLLVALMPYIFMACKKDITPTKSDLMIGRIDYDLKIISKWKYSFSNYDFAYSNENNILKTVNLRDKLDFFLQVLIIIEDLKIIILNLLEMNLF